MARSMIKDTRSLGFLTVRLSGRMIMGLIVSEVVIFFLYSRVIEGPVWIVTTICTNDTCA